jgi:alkylated DNA repair dioxygenase AlkB
MPRGPCRLLRSIFRVASWKPTCSRLVTLKDRPACLSNSHCLKVLLRSRRGAADFVSLETEQRLISGIQDLPLQPFQFGQFEGKRRVASFGFRYDYDLRQLQRSEPIPAWLDDIVAKVETFGGPATRIRQVPRTEYDVGVGIGWHREKPHSKGYSVFRWDPPASS